MCNDCPNRQAGYCACYDAFLTEANGVYERLYECEHPQEE